MCCGVPDDMYDLVIVVTAERDVASAFAAAFEARAAEQHVSVVLPRTEPWPARTALLRHALERSEVSILAGHAEPDGEGDMHYVTVEGRLIRGDRILQASTE